MYIVYCIHTHAFIYASTSVHGFNAAVKARV